MKILYVLAIFCYALSLRASVQLLSTGNVSKGFEWQTVNDTVMGGRSKSRWVFSKEEHSEFSGYLSLANNGGFTSVRHDLNNLDLTKTDGVYLKIKGDGRVYQFRIMSRKNKWADYSHDFKTVRDKEMLIYLPFKDFVATWRGLTLRMLPELTGKDVVGIGFFLADKKEGEFKLEITEIVATNKANYIKKLNILTKSILLTPQVVHNSSNLEQSEFFKIKFNTEDSVNYVIQSSSDLRNWYDVGEVLGTGSIVDYIDNNRILMHKYYRVKFEELTVGN